jgi:hypothetical protein
VSVILHSPRLRHPPLIHVYKSAENNAMIPHDSWTSCLTPISVYPMMKTMITLSLRSFTGEYLNLLHFFLRRLFQTPLTNSRHTILRLRAFPVRLQGCTFQCGNPMIKPMTSNKSHHSHHPQALKRRKRQSGDLSHSPHPKPCNYP